MSELSNLLNRGEFVEATAMAEGLLRAAQAKGPESLLEAARSILSWKGFFPNSAQAESSLSYFRGVLRLSEELAGADSNMAMAAADNLSGVLGSVDHLAEAISLKERVYARVSQLYPTDDVRFMSVRDGLAFLYRRAGEQARASELYRHTGICAHLQPLEQFLRECGEQPYSCGRPWSDNCHVWVFFDVVLDCDALTARLALDPCVRIHDHRGTHDGSERGLVCAVHQDAIVGRHPTDAGSARCVP